MGGAGPRTTWLCSKKEIVFRGIKVQAIVGNGTGSWAGQMLQVGGDSGEWRRERSKRRC